MSYNSKYKGVDVEEALDQFAEGKVGNVGTVDTSGSVDEPINEMIGTSPTGTRKVKDAKDLETDELIYFKGHAKATYMSDGRSVEEAINGIGTGGEAPDLSDYATKNELKDKQDKNLYFSNIETSNWVDSTEYAEYPYQCDLTCEGVRPEYYPEVVFGASEAANGNYAPVCETFENVVRIYSKVADIIVIPTIIINK